MNKSESIKELAQALTQAQAEMPAVQFNATNPFLKNKYADLGAIISATRPVLAAHGLSISQTMTCDDERIGVTSLLMHNSGEWLEDTATLPLGEERGKSLAQVAGSIVTYLRRYQWAALCGVYADEDGDGNGNKPAVPPADELEERKPEQQTYTRPYEPEMLKRGLLAKATNYAGANPDQTVKGVVVANLEKCFAGGDAKSKRHEFLSWLTGHASIKDVDGAVVLALKDWLKAQDSGGEWQPSAMAVKEANKALVAAEKSNGQASLLEE